MFSGYVDSSTETMLEGGGGAMYHKVAAVDNHYKQIREPLSRAGLIPKSLNGVICFH